MFKTHEIKFTQINDAFKVDMVMHTGDKYSFMATNPSGLGASMRQLELPVGVIRQAKKQFADYLKMVKV